MTPLPIAGSGMETVKRAHRQEVEEGRGAE